MKQILMTFKKRVAAMIDHLKELGMYEEHKPKKRIMRYDGKKWKQVQPLQHQVRHKKPETRKLTAKQIDRIMRGQTKL